MGIQRPPALDENLRQYATEKQWAYFCSVYEQGSLRAAARHHGIDIKTISEAVQALLRKAAQQGYAPDYGLTHHVPDGLTLKGTSTLYNAEGGVDAHWNKTRVAGRDPDSLIKIPDPKKIVKQSTLYDQQGQALLQWVGEKPEDSAREKLWREFAAELAKDLPRVPIILPPPSGNEDLLACYPVGDHHLGMLSWHEETGADYDISLGEKALANATDYLIRSSPHCSQALVVFLGDFMHYDSFESVTPTNRNLLDSDSRFPKMVRAAIRTMRRMIETAAKHHQHVHVIVEIGNHDPASSIFLMECLANIYAGNPRITVDTSPMHYHYYEWGKVLIGVHHGDKVKMEALPGIMAADRPEAWGRTVHRHWFTGHIHKRKADDYPGCTVESFRVLIPPDAWAAQRYRPTRDQKAITFHKEWGEVARHTVNAERVFP